jgi:hypothetical protein
VFTYLRLKFPNINKTKMTEGALIGQQIAKPIEEEFSKKN